MTGKVGDNRQSERPAHRVHLPGFVTARTSASAMS